MSWYSSGQNDGNKRWFLLDDQHADYAATIADIEALTEAHGETYTNDDGAVADQRVVYGYMTDAELAASSPSLTIGTAAVLDMMDYTPCINPNAAAVTIATNDQGDLYPIWGSFLEQPQALATTVVDRVVQHWKDGLETILYINQSGSGDESGSSYLNAAPVADAINGTRGSATANTNAATLVVFCGTLSRFRNEGTGAGLTGIWIRDGASGDRTALLAHPVDGANLMGGPKLACGASGESADFTLHGSGTYYATHNSSVMRTNHTGAFVLSDDSGTITPLTSAYTLAACIAGTDQYFYPRVQRGYWNATTTYAAGDRIQYQGLPFYALAASTNQTPPDVDYSVRGAAVKNTYWAQELLAVSSWSATVAYKVGDQANSGGNTYLSIQDGTNHAVSDTNYWVVIAAEGAWNSTATYPIGSCVQSGGTTYIAVAENTNDVPPSANWTTQERTYVHLASGNNPKATTYFGNATDIVSGVQLLTRDTTHVDIVGFGLYQARFVGTNHDYHSDISWINCKFLYGGGGKLFQATRGGAVNFQVGLFRRLGTTYTFEEPDAPNARQLLGCEIGFVGDGLYDTCTHSVVPTNTVIRDTYFHDGGVIAYGHNIGNSDSHAIATLGGWETALFRNNKFYRWGWLTNVIYTPDTGHPLRTTTLTDGVVATGDFASDMNWTKTGTAAIAGGVASLASGDTIEQVITIGPGFVSLSQPHALHFDLPTGTSVRVAVGTSSGGSEILAATTITVNPTTKHGAVAFTPTATTFYIRFIATASITIDNVRLPITLENEDGFVRGMPASGTFPRLTEAACMATNTDIEWSYNWITNPLMGGAKVGSTPCNHEITNEGQYYSLNGEITFGYGGQASCSIHHNRIEGVGTIGGAQERGFRIKWQLPSPYDTTLISFSDNVLRNVNSGIRSTQTSIDENGNNADCTFEALRNDIHATASFLLFHSTLNPTRRAVNSDDNIFRNDDGAAWSDINSTETTLADWRLEAGVNDVFDDNSTHVALYTDTGSPTITASGGPAVGSTLTASVGSDPDGATSSLSYQWFRNDVLIAGAEGTTYAATSGNGNAVDDEIECVVLGVDAEGKWFLVTSNTITLTAAGGEVTDDGDATVTITGTAREDSILTAVFADNDPDGAASGIGYQWQRTGGVDILGATDSTFTLEAGHIGLTIRVKVTYTDAEGFAETIYSAYTDEISPADHGDATATVAGNVVVGQVLTATFNDDDPDGAATGVTYQWQRTGVDIPGATASTYTIVTADVGHFLRVKVSYTDADGFAEVIYSAYTTQLAAPRDSGRGRGKKWKIVPLDEWLKLHHPEESVQEQINIVEEVAETIEEAPAPVVDKVYKELVRETTRVNRLVKDLKEQSAKVEGLTSFLKEMSEYKSLLTKTKKKILSLEKSLREMDDEEALMLIIDHA